MNASVPSVRDAPLTASYTYSSEVPAQCRAGKGAQRVPCVLGVDEAGRGPVLGPLVYGVAYCPEDQQEELREVGFADSKSLTAEKRTSLLEALREHHASMGRARLWRGFDSGRCGWLKQIFVDTVGDPATYARTLRGYFPKHPHIQWTVTRKADVIYPIVGAASIAAKVTRDRCLEHWNYAERNLTIHNLLSHKRKWEQDQQLETAADDTDQDSDAYITGSGYPGDPRTVRYLKETLDPVFGWAGIVRFSWATATTMLEEPLTKAEQKATTSMDSSPRYTALGTRIPTTTRGYSLRWIDEPATLTDYFSRTGSRKIGAARNLSTKASSTKAATEIPVKSNRKSHLQADRDAQRNSRPGIWADLSLSCADFTDIFKMEQ
ncbi:ribonuclease H [Malassezia psittaci]|uniref:Ribonuclease n=1 Tax=Malassezia psittaci TaxID=1821823 RepID=A0AAF0F6V5_9BASI|nr:ribonuclease H [Malassezia psittaci]